MTDQRTNLEATDTPLFLAVQMIARAGLAHGSTMLEPSAGTGAIASVAKATGVDVCMVELNAQRATDLHNRDLGPVWCGDFLSLQPGHFALFGKPAPLSFDAVVMNPPINAHPHVTRAIQFVRPGGRLVALLHRHIAQGFYDALGGEFEALPDDTFVFKGKPIPAAIWSVTL
ncbi:putative DNA modification methylase [Bajunvirus bajun]|uniref:DNA modification methylase n=1 Tax=Brevundimonas phage vB_BgoS-Bajun TaxID=2948594 RepID=A0A9E7SUS9_9CAUD|nr:putative DNA modification methylase [Brevundimonas phage vB_BgoS-Bajun]